eukprot:6585122-Prymnesium_polylepis.1
MGPRGSSPQACARRSSGACAPLCADGQVTQDTQRRDPKGGGRAAGAVCELDHGRERPPRGCTLLLLLQLVRFCV